MVLGWSIGKRLGKETVWRVGWALNVDHGHESLVDVEFVCLGGEG